MAIKNTEELENEITRAEDVTAYLDENRDELVNFTLPAFLQQLLTEKHLTKAEVIRRTGMETTYGYHIFDGKKGHPSRGKVLQIALAMELTPRETQHLLHHAGWEALYARSSFDSAIWYALEHHLNVIDTNLLLEKLGEEPLS